MPLLIRHLLEMRSEMIERYDLEMAEVRLNPADYASIRTDADNYGFTGVIRIWSIPSGVVEFFVPHLHRRFNIGDWNNFGMLPGVRSYTAISGQVSEATFTPPTERIFTFEGGTFTCRLTAEPIPAVPRVSLPGVPSMDAQLRAISRALEPATAAMTNLHDAMMRTMREATERQIDDLLSIAPAKSVPLPFEVKVKATATRIDFLLEEIDGGVDEPHAED